MNKTLLVAAMLISSFSLQSAETCKIMIFEDKGWFPESITKAFEAKNYEFVSRDFPEEELDLIVNYVPYTAASSLYKNKRYVYFEVKESIDSRPLIFTQIGSSKRNFSYLFQKINKRALRKIDKNLSYCNK